MNSSYSKLRKKIITRDIRIAVVGLGYVGLPLAVEFAKKGFLVRGIDVDQARIGRLNKKISYITDVKTGDLKKVIKLNKFKAESSFRALEETEAVFVCVPTPLKRRYHPDISFILGAARQIRKHLHRGQLIILESTTYPGTTEEEILPLLEKGGLVCGKDFFLAFSPERIDPGNTRYPLRKIPKVVGGLTREATELSTLLYKNLVEKVIPVSSARVAESVKLLENTFRIVNIGLIDELAQMAHKMDIDIWEVIEAARSKPFGFMPFYPGPGAGGHCLDKKETVFIREANALKALQMPELIEHIQNNESKNIEILSFDPVKRESVFKKIVAASVRPYGGMMMNIATEDGRLLKVTDLHPMFTCNNGRWQLKYAKDLQRGDPLPICLGLPNFQLNTIADKYSIDTDILNELKKRNSSLISKIRVKPTGFRWSDYADQLKSIFRDEMGGKISDRCRDYLSDNYLPLKYLFILEKYTPIDHRCLKLSTGRGASYSEIPAVVGLNEDFCRLIGYYLSKGCFTPHPECPACKGGDEWAFGRDSAPRRNTENKGATAVKPWGSTKDKSVRVRFSFNRSEKEYIDDVSSILEDLGIRVSVHESKQWKSTCIKVSSDVFGFLINEVLNCGKNCYTMRIPDMLFGLGYDNKKALLAGLFRGDGCVEHFFGKWRYRKNEKEYFHNVNTAHISYFTSSRELFQQMIVLLHDLGIVATFKKRKYSLSIFGYPQLNFFKQLFDGKKKHIIEQYLKLSQNRAVNKTFKRFDNFAVVKVKSIVPSFSEWVYSLETEKPHAFVTSYGIVVHNCIPKDPLYLYWKAKKFGFRSRFIKLSSEIISQMPLYVVERLSLLLGRNGLSLKEAKILIAGVTYKKDVLDLRKSPALEVIEDLMHRGARVSYSDPLIPYLRINSLDMRSVKLSREALGRFDCVLILTDHSRVDYKFIAHNARLIFDTRNVYKGVADKKIYRL